MSKEGGGGAEKEQSSTGRDERGVAQSKSVSSFGQEQTPLECHVASVSHATTRTGEGNVPRAKTNQPTGTPNISFVESASKETTRQPPESETMSSLPGTYSQQVIAVSASKKPAVFFNLARKFLATDGECDLSALEGAILTAVDAAHLLERSKIAKIVRIQTSYVSVEPKRRKNASSIKKNIVSHYAQKSTQSSVPPTRLPTTMLKDPPFSSTFPYPAVSDVIAPPQDVASKTQDESTRQRKNITGRRAKGVPLRRARIVITVRRTEDYKIWLEETPYEAIAAGEDDLGDEEQDKLRG
eukprot:CAMPEP_0197823580 /NCGR_PEP_ID=MMETSP1437-20131217/906_1 /TAXON_ID=49252 ORGANISM="Eucampia antarctica, Strain CCMP1452" /NCGR_SAMPLE_ID=MMETSP1437 /ASSEMBLY_ACC=CAM_ASM_001096 /LENGTH=297 /DNA_ID=CAMNT_0043422815 /DNA_START=344 /DNA_END=1237 /DNA_ORIENTATION=-